jgi:hypothetical protein
MGAGRLQIVLALAVLGVHSGCRGLTQQAALPTKYRMQVDQLVFNTNFKLRAEDPLVRDLTAERSDICRTLGLPCANQPIDVFLFDDAETYGQFLARHYPLMPSRRAFFLETETSLAVYAHRSERLGEDMRHEVAHGYLHAVAPKLPLWLDEGLAEYFEVPRGHGGLNRPHVALLTDLHRLDGWRPNLEQLEQLGDASQMKQPHYAEAWAWVYFLLHARPETRELLTDYLADVRDRGRIEPLSVRLAALQAQPGIAMVDFVTGLRAGRATDSRVGRASGDSPF